MIQADNKLNRFIRNRDAAAYLGMNKTLFQEIVRPFVSAIPIGIQGIAFDRLDLDAWADDYKRRNGRPAQKTQEGLLWDEEECQGLSSSAKFGTSTKKSRGTDDFAKALVTVRS